MGEMISEVAHVATCASIHSQTSLPIADPCGPEGLAQLQIALAEEGHLGLAVFKPTTASL